MSKTLLVLLLSACSLSSTTATRVLAASSGTCDRRYLCNGSFGRCHKLS